jgi:hypothetical protein
VEEDKRQGSETLHFPFVTKFFRTIRFQRILKFCISIILKGGYQAFSFWPIVPDNTFSPELIQGRSKTHFSVKTGLCVSFVISHFTSFLICVFCKCVEHSHNRSS